MDRGLISPGPDLTWHVSHVFYAPRSSAESELLALQGKDILLPKDEAFYPSQLFAITYQSLQDLTH